MKKFRHTKIYRFGVLILLILILGLSFYKFKTDINVQQPARSVSLTISTKEIDFYLDQINRQRFLDEDKKIVRDFIKSELKKYGYDVSEQFTDGKIQGLSKNRVFTNIIASKEPLNSNHVIIGAHYDTVPNTTGMDDNGSGVAALLSIAKYNTNKNITFIAFDGEEYNLSGSRFYVKNLQVKPKLMVSLETMGFYTNQPNTQNTPKFYDLAFPAIYNRLKQNNFRGNFSTAICTHQAISFCRDYEAYSAGLNLQAYTIMIPDLLAIRNLFFDLFRSDHTPFLQAGIPSVMISDTADFRNSNYHQPSDTRQTINAEFIAKQSTAILNALNTK